MPLAPAQEASASPSRRRMPDRTSSVTCTRRDIGDSVGGVEFGLGVGSHPLPPRRRASARVAAAVPPPTMATRVTAGECICPVGEGKGRDAIKDRTSTSRDKASPGGGGDGPKKYGANADGTTGVRCAVA